jgi:hypothetical protein
MLGDVRNGSKADTRGARRRSLNFYKRSGLQEGIRG